MIPGKYIITTVYLQRNHEGTIMERAWYIPKNIEKLINGQTKQGKG